MFTKVYENLTDWWDTQHKNGVYEKTKDLIEKQQRNPTFILSELEYAKALTKQGSTVFQDGTHSPEQLNIKDLNDLGNKDKVRFWQKTIIDESGNERKAFCCNAEVALEMAQE
jgi:hypothetical protein